MGDGCMAAMGCIISFICGVVVLGLFFAVLFSL